MNWRRGFIRAWILLSLIWVAVVAAYAVNERRTAVPLGDLPDNETSKYEITDPSGQKYLITALAGTPQSQVLEYVKQKFGNVHKTGICIEKNPPPWCTDTVLDEMPTTRLAGDNYMRLIVIGAGVPALVFALGASALWVAAGFRRV